MSYDEERIRLFKTLYEALKREDFPSIEEPNKTDGAFRNFAFFESYFSSYEVGTVLDIDEAKNSVDTGKPLPPKNKHEHDILGTYRVMSDRREMSRTPKSYEELIDIMLSRHSSIMAAKPDSCPGTFKTVNNCTKYIKFVDHTLVQGTLKKGFEYYQALTSPFARALYLLYMVSEVHPFIDGNGRMSRIMMNAELVSAGQSKIMLPTVFRKKYIDAQKALSHECDPTRLIKDMQHARRFSAKITGEDYAATRAYLERCNAFISYRELILKADQS